MDENLNVLDDTQTGTVDQSQTEQVTTPNETVNADNVEVTSTQESEKPVQDAETNAKFATQRRDNEQKAYVKAQDDLVARQYGSSHGIYTVADYDKAIKTQEAEQQAQTYKDAGYDQEMINKMINENPTVMQANSIIQKQTEDNRINGEIQDLFSEFPECKDSKIPDSVFLESMNKGIALKYAYSMYANKNSVAIAEQKTLRGLQQNSATSPGALSTGQQPLKSDYSTMSSKDFENIVQKIQRGEKIN